MLEVKGTKIKLTRGDSAYIGITPMVDGEPYILSETDSVHLQVRNADADGELVFDGTLLFEDSEITWYIAPSDTSYLDFDTYYWDAELHVGDDVFTFIRGRLTLTNEVTRDS